MAKINLKTAIPGPKSKELFELRRKHISRAVSHITPLVVAKAKGCTIEDVDGNTFLDFTSGIGVANVGHLASKVTEAIVAQTQRHLHTSFNVAAYEPYIRLCEKLNHATPGTHPKKSILVNSGTEAVENAIKIARAFTNRQAVICFDHAFHGRTYMAMTLTSKYKPYKYGFGPFNGEVYRAPFPYAYRWPTTSASDRVSEECFQEFERLINTQLSPTQVAAVIIEPVLGEGGFVPAPKAFLQKLRDYCTTNEIVLIADEIQSGFGRAGAMFACEELGIVPDLIITAKGLGGGMPISAVTGRIEIMDAPIEGGIGGTYAGNPVSCAAALAVFDIFEKENVIGKAKATGDLIRSRLMSWKENIQIVGDARGMGCMQAIELVKSKTGKEPHPEATKALVKYCYEHGVITMSAGSSGNIIRLLMPIVISPEELNEGLDVIESGLKTLA